MEKILLMFFVCIISSTYAQSKKEQIENLNYQIDSLNQVLLKEEKLNTNSTFEISQLNAELTRLNGVISTLNAEVSKLTSSLKSNQEELFKLQEQLKVKSDSLLLVQKELDNLKPPPIQINNTPAVLSQQIGPYKTVQIGTQVWMTKNIDVSTFRNGDPIPEAKTDKEWGKAGENKQPAWCYYNNDPANGAKYGKLYNWYAVNDTRGLAPEGWHIPDIDEWDECLNQIKIDDVNLCNGCSGSPRISIVSTHNEFSKQLGGCRFNYMAKEFYGFIGLFESSYFWSSNEIDNWGEFVLIGDDQPLGIFDSNLNGFSIRCIKD